MWLINVEDRKLELFNDERRLPPYAILSHTWTGSEITMQEYREAVEGNSVRSEYIRSTKGYAKIDASCLQARSDCLSHVWIDTCAIDKTSSAELSEAINSMFRWYQNAEVCYVYLEDIQIPTTAEDGMSSQVQKEHLAQAKWFSRGWTLQELIAPTYAHFFDRNWCYLGTKESLMDCLTQITGIDAPFLCGRDLNKASIAKRMSWAAGRVTTKVEDIAYSLFGIFGVNMPLLYGEGKKAFQRLQEEILNETDDQSLFAWQGTGTDYSQTPRALPVVPLDRGISIFAPRPDVFLSTADAESYIAPGEMSLAGGKGLKCEVPLLRLDQYSPHYVAILGSVASPQNARPEPDEADVTGIVLQELCLGHFMRHPTAPLVRVNRSHVREDDARPVYIRKAITPLAPMTTPSYTASSTRSVTVKWW